MSTNGTTPPSLPCWPRIRIKEKNTSRSPWRNPLYLGICACWLIIMLALLIALLTIFLRVRAVKTLVELDYAQYQGVELSSGINHWLGIRYAAPPVGDLRFAAPQDPKKEDTVQPANEPGNACLTTAAGPPGKGTSEDCLFLEVQAPAKSTIKSKLPVFVFFPGGGFNIGATADLNATSLIQASGMNMVFVSLSYRVGPYGFLASSELEKGGSINNGLLDQRKALHWVQKYISQFGGDPKHVVIGGASAGAASVTLQLSAYGGRDDGLFHASAAESQSFAAVRNITESQYQYDDLVQRTGCAKQKDTLACLRGLNSTFLQEKNTNEPFPGATGKSLYPYGPVLDHDFIIDPPYTLFDQGKFVKVPAIYGDDSDEGTIFAHKSLSTSDESNAFLKDQFPLLNTAQLGKIDSLYIKGPQYAGAGSYWSQASLAYGEMRYICPGIFLSSAYDRAGIKGIWNYRYDVSEEPLVSSGYGTPHTAEMGAIFFSPGSPASYQQGHSNANVVPIIQAYWASFIRCFDPNKHRSKDAPNWQEWTQKGVDRLLLEVNTTRMEKVSSEQQERCAYLSGIGPSLEQ